MELKRCNEELTQENRKLIKIIDLPRSTSQYVQHEIPRHLNFNADVSDIPGLIKAIDSTRSFSKEKKVHGLIPVTKSILNIELMTRHPFAYPWINQLEVNESTSYLASATANIDQSDIDRLLSYYPSTASETSAMPQQPGPIFPEHSNRYCDDRLQALDVGRWSNVPADNVLAASAISFYLKSEHPLIGCFDADLLLNDLIAGSTRFCSSLLVNSLLFRACVSRTAAFPKGYLISC